jgi:hypothetical protein
MKDLAERVARLFSPKPWKHSWPSVHKDDDCDCTKCGRQQEHEHLKSTTCPIPDPIDITDLGKALECFRGLKNGRVFLHRWYVKKHNMDESLDELLEGYEMSTRWMLHEATAEQIWEICCLAKEASK